MKLYNFCDVEVSIDTLIEKVDQLEKITIKQQNELNKIKRYINSTINFYTNPLGFTNNDIDVDNIIIDITLFLKSIKELYEKDKEVEKLIFSIKEIKLYEFNQEDITPIINKINKTENKTKTFFQYIIDIETYLNNYINYCKYYIYYDKEKIRNRNIEKLSYIKSCMDNFLIKLNKYKENLNIINDRISNYL